MITRTLAQSFAGGEVTPEFWGRVDDAKFQMGLAGARNFQILPHGPAQNRAGFQFVHEVKDSTAKTRLIPFTYSTTQTMVLEFGNQYIRFHTLGAILLNGGVPYEVATPYLTADLFSLHFVQSQDVLTIVHPNYAPMELRRLGAVNWTLTTINFGTTMTAPTSVVVAATVNGASNLILHEYVVTTVGATGDESLMSSPANGGITAAITGITQANPGVLTVNFGGSASLQVGQAVVPSGIVGMTQLNGNTYYVGSVNSTTVNYGVDYTGTITTLTLVDVNGIPVNTSGFGAYTSGGTLTFSGVMNNLFATGTLNSISWSAAAGATYYNVYKKSHGVWGYVGQTTQTAFKDDSITPNTSQTPPIAYNPFTGAGNYPGAVSYFQQRRCFAGSTNAPQSIWMTKSGTEANLNYSLPSQSSDSISVRVAAREANTIRHLVPLNNLLPLTSSAEWMVTSVNSDAITPSSISVKPQAYTGASNVQPVVVNNSILYVSARNGHVREMGYAWQANGYITSDVSLRAPHLFDGYDIVDMAFARSPYPILWGVSTSGLLLGLTYVPEQQIGAWHHHDTGAGPDVFEACTVVTENGRDVLYVIVARNINGVTKRYVECSAPRLFTNIVNAFFVDAGLTYNGAPATTISGLNHLIGCTVAILADGAVVANQVVDNTGSISLSTAASVVTAGLPITADLTTLPIALAIPGDGNGRPKNINKAFVRVYNSRGLKAGPDTNNLKEDKERTTELYGSPPNPQFAEMEIVLTPSWSTTGSITVRQDAPLPSTIVSICYEVAVGG